MGRGLGRRPLRALIAAALALGACGGDDDNGNATNGGTGGGNGGGTTQPASVRPLSGGSLYVGAVSFGDTVSVELDKPAAGQLTLRFLDSRFGLAGALVGQYVLEDGTYRVTGLAASGTNVPAAWLPPPPPSPSASRSMTASSPARSARCPTSRPANGALLQGYISAGNRGAQLADIAGTYSYLRQTGDAASAGQLNIGADGSVRVCAGLGYSADCAGGQTGKLAADADQSRYPGAFALTLGGSPVGRLFVGRQQGQIALFIDETGASATAPTGSWVVRTAAAVAANGIDGDWVCAEPELDDSNAATGRTRRNIVSVAGTTLAADNIPVDVTLDYNRAGGGAASGLVSGTWQATVAGQTQSLGLTWLPVSKKLAYQLRQVPGSARQLPAVCAPMATPTPVSTYLSATAGQNILVTLADLRPTSRPSAATRSTTSSAATPQTRSRSSTTPAKPTARTRPAPGMRPPPASATSLPSPAPRQSATSRADMKTLVVGPVRRSRTSTDGHHSFTSLWDADTGGAQVEDVDSRAGQPVHAEPRRVLPHAARAQADLVEGRRQPADLPG